MQFPAEELRALAAKMDQADAGIAAELISAGVAHIELARAERDSAQREVDLLQAVLRAVQKHINTGLPWEGPDGQYLRSVISRALERS